MQTIRGLTLQTLPQELLDAAQPLHLPGLVRHSPTAVAALEGPDALRHRLLAHWKGARAGVWRGAAAIQGRFFYNDDCTGLNFDREVLPFDQLVDTLLALSADAAPPALYMGSTSVEDLLPGYLQENALDWPEHEPLASLWLGNRCQIAAHFDWPDNLACVLAGRRRFTLFPPDQVANLYMGPLEFTPAGQPISMVDICAPDLNRYPRYAQALAHAQVVDLEPGDALFIPSLWWHHVQSLEPVNLLLNYWWTPRSPAAESPLQALMLSALTLRALPPAQRKAWQALFQHCCFQADPSAFAHIPAHARGVLDELDAPAARAARHQILRRLIR